MLHLSSVNYSYSGPKVLDGCVMGRQCLDANITQCGCQIFLLPRQMHNLLMALDLLNMNFQLLDNMERRYIEQLY